MVIILNFLFKTAGDINHGHSPLKYSVVVLVISSFLWEKDIHTIFVLCVQNGWDGGHWSLLRKLYGRNNNLIDYYGITVSQMTTDKFHLSQALLGPFLVQHLSKNTN
jgi:hypothetical protein